MTNEAPELKDPGARRLARRLFLILSVAVLLGVVMPFTTILMKFSADDFRQWRKLLAARPALADLVRRHPWADIERSCGFLSRLSWTNSDDYGEIAIYMRDATFEALLLVALFLFRERLRTALTAFATWYRTPGERRAKRAVLGVSLLVILSFPTKAFSGVFFPGIGGWTYEGFVPDTVPDLPPLAPEKTAVLAAAAPFLDGAIVAANGRFVEREGYLTRRAMFFHFRNGAVLPANYELFEVPQTNYVFGAEMREAEPRSAFVRVLKTTLDERRAGRRFLLPNALAYPNHSPYMPIDYTDYPPAADLVEISFWSVTAAVRPGHPAKVVRGVKEVSIDAR